MVKTNSEFFNFCIIQCYKDSGFIKYKEIHDLTTLIKPNHNKRV
jgi:hypothetical protein